MKKLTRTPNHPSKPLTFTTEKVRDLQPLSDDKLRDVVGGQPPGSSHTTGG